MKVIGNDLYKYGGYFMHVVHSTRSGYVRTNIDDLHDFIMKQDEAALGSHDVMDLI